MKCYELVNNKSKCVQQALNILFIFMYFTPRLNFYHINFHFINYFSFLSRNNGSDNYRNTHISIALWSGTVVLYVSDMFKMTQ